MVPAWLVEAAVYGVVFVAFGVPVLLHHLDPSWYTRLWR